MGRCESGGLALALVSWLGACGKESAGPLPQPMDTTPVLAAAVDIPAFYGIHDTYVRDGIAYVSAWNTGIMIFDVGNGVAGGSPTAPVPLDTTPITGGYAHTALRFNNYLFVSQEGPARIGKISSGDLHVLDVSDLSHPVEVASYGMDPADSAGAHNLWMDESNAILYIAYYNAGIVSLDVSGTLSGDLTARAIDTIAPGGPGNTFTWGVQLANGSLYAIDMLSGLWQLSTTGGHMSVASGSGNNVPERYSSDLWITSGHAYTGTWGFGQRTVGASGNVLKVWALSVTGAPTLVDSVMTTGITTVSDVEVSADGKLLLFSAEGGPGNGIYLYSLADPAHPAFRGKYMVSTGVHTATFGYIGGKVYVFAAKDPASPQLLILDATALDR